MRSRPSPSLRLLAWLLVWLLFWQSALFPALAAFYVYGYSTGTLVGVSDTSGHGTGFAYDSNGQKTGQSTSRTLINPDGSSAGVQTMTTSMVLDGDGRVVKTLLPDGATTQTHYNAIGKVDYTVDALKRVTNFHFNDLGQRDTTTYADGTKSSTVYDANEQVVGSVDRSGRGSQTLYDSLGRASSTLSLGTNGQPFHHSDGSVIQSQTLYDDAGQAVASIDELGHKSQTNYDAAGEAVASTIYDADANGNAVARTSTTDYDGDGRAIKSTDALGRYSVPTYDAGGRVIATTSYDRNGNALSQSQTHYDSLGRVDYATDAAGHVKRMSYDSLGRLSAVIQATQGTPTADGSGQYDLVSQFRYDEVGHKILQQDANGHITRFGYDIRGRMTWRALPMGGAPETMVYDAGGQLKQSTDFRGYATSYQYDDRGRLLAKVPDARLNEAGLFYSYPDENTRTTARGNATTTQHYDPQRGWLSSVSGPNGTVSYSYNPEGQKVAMTSPSGTTGYGYDVLGRLSAINDQPSGATAPTNIAAYAYDAVGNLSSLTRGNGVVTRYAFDEQNRLSDLVNTTNAGELSRFHYTLRADGKRTGINESVVDAPDASTGAARSSVRSLAYTYDNAGKLTGETGQDGLGVAYANSWNYDAVGNRTSATVQKAATAGATTWAHTTSVSAVFNANDQLTSSSSVVDGGTAQTQSYGYDQNGAEKTVASTSGTSTNGWDFEGKLTATALADASGAANGGSANSFDAQGDRLARTSDVGKASQKTTSYLVDTDTSYSQVVEERAPDVSDAAGQPALQARYVWGSGLAPLAMWRKMADGSVKLFFYQTDGQESVRQLTSSTGEVTDSYFYDAWGNGLAGGSGTTENPFRYTGQQRDPDGRYYLRDRFYNPGNGRFLSHDPLMGSADDPASLHRYLYAGADGVNSCDPSGDEEFSLTNVVATTAITAGLGADLGYSYFSSIGGSGVEGIIVGAEIGGSLGYGASTGNFPRIFIAGSFGGIASVMAKGVIDFFRHKPREAEGGVTYQNQQVREFLRGFASGCLASVIGQYLHSHDESYEKWAVAASIIVQDTISFVSENGIQPKWQTAVAAIVGTGLDALMEAVLDKYAEKEGEGLETEAIQSLRRLVASKGRDFVIRLCESPGGKEAFKDVFSATFAGFAGGSLRSSTAPLKNLGGGAANEEASSGSE